MAHHGIARSLELLRLGQDISAPQSVLKLSPLRACERVPGAPYSIADNVAHAELWQRVWLAKLGLAEAPDGSFMSWDWPTVELEGWPEVRRRFLEGLDSARLRSEERPQPEG